jgi:hypothetical protein
MTADGRLLVMDVHCPEAPPGRLTALPTHSEEKNVRPVQVVALRHATRMEGRKGSVGSTSL